MNVMELPTLETFFEEGYLLANKNLADFVQRGGDVRAHFVEWGRHEGRVQISREFMETRRRRSKEKYEKFERVFEFSGEWRFLEQEGAFPISVGTRHFDLGQYDSESANPTYGPFADEAKNHPDRLFMDLGAGFRSEVFDNCLYVEVYPSLTADVIVEPDCVYPIASNSLDGIGCFAVLEHVSQPWKVVEEIRRMLKPGGKAFIDWPFLQPVHGYPSHYFNATRQGLELLFSEGFELQFCRTEGNQTPAFTIQWLVGKFLHDLPSDKRARVESLSLRELVSQPPTGAFWQEILSGLPDAMISEFACGNTLVAVKR